MAIPEREKRTTKRTAIACILDAAKPISCKRNKMVAASLRPRTNVIDANKKKKTKVTMHRTKPVIIQATNNSNKKGN